MGNEAVFNLYRSLGFVEFGCYPKAFRSRTAGWQPLIYMYLDLSDSKTSPNE